MALITENEIIFEALKSVAQKIVLAARTAPKGRGISNLFAAIAERKDIDLLIERMIKIGTEQKQDFFIRDANNLKETPIVVLLGTRIEPQNIAYCGYCGFTNCTEKSKHPKNPCAFNTGDLGIAIGSAVSIAMDHRVDNRIMYTAGRAAVELEMISKDVQIAYGIPLSATSKNPFFDRVHH